MWQPLARARRRLGGAKPPVPPHGNDTVPESDLEFALNRADLERLMTTLTTVPGVEPGRPDTPARLEAALRVAIARANGRGTPVVTRRPAGLYTPETWQIGVEGADRQTQLALEQAIHGGGHA